jgi:hypothetical protein
VRERILETGLPDVLCEGGFAGVSGGEGGGGEPEGEQPDGFVGEEVGGDGGWGVGDGDDVDVVHFQGLKGLREREISERNATMRREKRELCLSLVCLWSLWQTERSIIDSFATLRLIGTPLSHSDTVSERIAEL